MQLCIVFSEVGEFESPVLDDGPELNGRSKVMKLAGRLFV
jgi:hypothetical protein